MIIEEKAKYTKLTAEADYVLTKAAATEDRTFVHSVCTKTPELWAEWSTEEMERWLAEHPQAEEEETE